MSSISHSLHDKSAPLLNNQLIESEHCDVQTLRQSTAALLTDNNSILVVLLSTLQVVGIIDNCQNLWHINNYSATRSDGHGFSRRNSRSWSPRARTAKAPRSRSSQARFSYISRRSSLGKTPIYRSPYMASLDAYLNTTSGLRLQTDGKCTFSFERRRFAIRCAAPEDGGDGDYTFYLCIGPMKELQVKVRSKNLVKLIASWNE